MVCRSFVYGFTLSKGERMDTFSFERLLHRSGLGNIYGRVASCMGALLILSSPVQAGRVIDAQTGEIIKDANVVTAWTRQVEAGTAIEHPECIAIQSVETATSGEYHLPQLPTAALVSKSDRVRQYVFAFKPGYREDSQSFTEEVMRRGDFYLERETLGPDMRMSYLVAVLARLECPAQSDRRTSIAGLLREVYRESGRLPRKGKVGRDAAQVERRIAYAWAGKREMVSPDELDRYFNDVVVKEILSGDGGTPVR